ncbi:MAG: hypothetical protein FH748_02670 [Balneolaceae bacterium]|nr:hypothetical protein [Balneolaceae bacterium]
MKTLLILGFSLFLLGSAYAQGADEYFHNGAQSFIKSNLQEAISQVQQGLAQYPNDPKLNALMQQLREQEEKQKQQQQNQSQNQNQDQQKQDQQQQNQQNQNSQDQQNQDKQENKQNQQQQNQSNNQENAKPQEGQPQSLQQMSKAEAEKILKALAQKEKELLKEFKKQKTKGNTKHEKDW